jgi:hypothetical protein
MVKTALLATDLTAGSRVLEYLDESDLAMKVVAWVYLEDYDDWRFALASPRLDAVVGPKAYGLVHQILEAKGLAYAKTPPLTIFGMKERFIRELRTLYPKTEDREGRRIGSQTIGDRHLEDGILYRVR